MSDSDADVCEILRPNRCRGASGGPGEDRSGRRRELAIVPLRREGAGNRLGILDDAVASAVPSASGTIAAGAPVLSPFSSLRSTVVASIGVLSIASAVPRGGDDASVAGADGPYVFPTAGGSFLVSTIVGHGDTARVETRPLAADAPEFELDVPGAASPLRVRIRSGESDPACEFPAATRLFAVSDIEGECARLVALLTAGGVVDDRLNWTFGDGHLVFLGDFFDRGQHVTETLWLCYELEERARRAGGAAHFLLGNHEVMNLTGDFRYVRNKYRENARLLGRSLAGLYAKDSVLGAWLRTRNAAVRIGSDLFVHGGVSPRAASVMAGSSLVAMNVTLRAALLADTFPTDPPERLAAVVDPSHGWIWYRGCLREPRIGSAELDSVLAIHGVRRLVIGHTLVERIGFAHQGRVLAIDVHHAGGASEAAAFSSGVWRRVTATGILGPIEELD